MGKQYGCLITICAIFLYLTEPSDSLNWTAQPANPTALIKGQNVSLTWNFSLTANEQACRQYYYGIIWKKFNSLSASFDDVGSRVFVQVFGKVQYSEPKAPHIVVDRTEAIDSAALQIKNVQSDDEARYKIEYSVKTSGPPAGTQEFNLTVLVPPSIADVSSDQVVCEGFTATLSCNVTGKPTPNISWKRAFDNGTDSAPLLPVVDGKYVMNNITRSSNGTYRCTASNGVGDPVNRTVRVTVRYSASVVRIVNLSNTVNEGGSFSMTCEASGNPKPNVLWIKMDNGQRIDGSLLNFTNINRNDTGRYRCKAENDCGNDSRVQSVKVYYPSEIAYVSSDQDVCEGSLVALSCNATSNPTPSITWTRAFDNGTDSAPLLPVVDGKYVINNITKGSYGTYRCTANNGVGDPVNRTARITVRYSAYVVRIVSSSNTVNEGGHFYMTCEASGDPEPNVHWINVDNGQRINGNILNFTNINRSDTGEYRCEAENRCGSRSGNGFVDVYYPAGIVSAPSSQQVVEAGEVTLFCNATGNPQPNITWTKQGSSFVLSSSETLRLTNLRSGDNGAVYKCKVENIIGSREAISTITVLYAPNVTIQQCSTPVNEEESATLYCNATGNPVPNIKWIRISTGEIVSYNKMLNLSNIKRNESSSYECLAWNNIGNNTKSCTIYVYYRPSSSALTTIPSNTTVLHGKTLSLICSTDANPLNSVTYHFYFNDLYIGNCSLSVFNVTVEADGVYTCVPINTVGTGQNATVNVTAVVAPSIEVHKTTYTVVEGNEITLFCNAYGKPTPSIKWIRVGSSEVLSITSTLTVMNVSRPGTSDNMVQYQCTASNGVESPATAVSNITVHYPPKIKSPKAGTKEAERGAIIKCDAEGNPSPTYRWRNGTGGVVASEKTFTLTYDGNYTCIASNKVGFDTHSIVIEIPSHYYQGEMPVEKLNGVAVEFKPEYNDLNSLSAKEFLDKVLNEIDKLYRKHSLYNRTEVTGLRKGSVIVSFMLYFTTPVTTSEGLAKLRAAADNGTLGPFTVGALKIIQNVIATGIPSVSPTGATTVADPTEEKTASSPSGISTTLEFTLTITNKDCKVRSEVEQKLLTEIPKTVQYLGGLKDIKIQEIRCGSIIVDFLLRFNQSVVAVDVISALITAVRQGKFGNFSVDTNSIKQRKLPSMHTDTRDTSTQDTSTQDTSTQDTSTQDTSTQDTSTQDPVCNIPSFIKDENCKVKIWKVVVLVVAVVVTMALVLGIAACWLHRRRTFRKEHRSQCALGTRRKNETAM